MERIGVEAIVEGLSSFLGDMGSMDKAISKLLPGTDLLSNAFGFLGDVVNGLVGGALRVLEFTLGNLLADAIETVISKIGELISNIIEAGNEFQILTIRMQGLNMQDAIDSGLEYEAAMQQAVAITKEQLEWLQTLGAATPFDPVAINNVYTLARSYGFADDEARRLTKDVLEFSAGMGLSNAHLERVIQNFGQMVQRGKITSTEIRDLARGAFLPVNDVLERIVKNSDGAFSSVAQLQKAISKPGEGVPAEMFIEAFEQMVEEEPRFVGAAGRLGRAFLPAVANVKELVTSVFGLNVVKPVLDVLGEKVAGMVDLFVAFNQQGDLVKTERWDKLVAATTKLGEAISTVISEVLGLIPSTESLADGLIAGIDSFAQLILENKDNIVGFFRNIGSIISEKVLPFIGQVAQKFIDWVTGEGGQSGLRSLWNMLSGIGKVITENIVPFVNNFLLPAWEKFSTWVNDNQHLINGFFRSLGEIFTKLVEKLTDQAVSGEGGVLAAITAFMQFVTQNEDLIVSLINSFIQLNLSVLALKATFALAATSITLAMVSMGAAIAGALNSVYKAFQDFVNWIVRLLGIGSPSKLFMTIGQGIIQGLILGIQGSIIQAYSVGANIVNAIADGIRNSVGALITAARDAALSAYDAALQALGIRSPSVLFLEIGQNTMTAMALGIQSAAAQAADTMRAATMQVSVAAMQGASSIMNNNNTSNYNLTVNSGAPSEPIVQDYNMLMSLSGA